MKRYIVLLLVILFSFCGCANPDPTINVDSGSTSSSQNINVDGGSANSNQNIDTNSDASNLEQNEESDDTSANQNVNTGNNEEENAGTNTSTVTSTAAEELPNVPAYINKDDLANRSYELCFLLGQDGFSSPNELAPNVIVQFAFCHIYYGNLCSMPTTGMKLRETTRNEIEAQISKYFGNVSTDVTKSDLYNKADQKFKMWEPKYGTAIFYDTTLTKNNEGLYVSTTTFYTDATKKNIQGKTVLTVEDNGSRAIIKKLSTT